MRLARKLHLYTGVFFAPAIIFFALSGFFQAFGWQEEHDGKQPLGWVVTISEIHKDQRLPAPRPQPVAAPASTDAGAPPANAAQSAPSPGKAAGAPRPRRKKSFPLQVFMGIMAVSLIGSTLVGLWMAFKIQRNTALVLGLLIAGTVIPLAALYIGIQP